MEYIRLKDIGCDIFWYETDENWAFRSGYWDYSDNPDRDKMYRESVTGCYESDDGTYSGMAHIRWNEDGGIEEVEFIIWAASRLGWKNDLNKSYYYIPNTDNSDIWDTMQKILDVWNEKEGN